MSINCSPNLVLCALRGSELLTLVLAIALVVTSHYDCQLGPPYDDYHQSRYQVCWSGRSAGHPSPWVFSQKAAPQLPRVAGNATSTPPNPILWGLRDPNKSSSLLVLDFWAPSSKAITSHTTFWASLLPSNFAPNICLNIEYSSNRWRRSWWHGRAGVGGGKS